jgi:type IV pilus assembly protein PilW
MRPTGPGRNAAVQRGVTIVELMVGLLIGMVVTFIVARVLLTAEGHKRTTTTGMDAQVNSALALFTLQRDIEMAGYGLTAAQAGLGCTVQAVNFNSSNGGNRTLAPVLITDGANGAADTIRILASANVGFTVPILVTGNHPTAGTGSEAFNVANSIGVKSGDLMIAVPPAPSPTASCTVFRANGTVGATSIQHASSATDTGQWNGSNADALMAKFPNGGYPKDSYLINLGTAGLIDKTFSVNANGALQVVEFDTATRSNLAAREIAPNVANLQAMYGKDTDGDGVIDVYNVTTPTSAVEWSRVIALRLALVTRSAQFEKDVVTSAAPVWDLGGSPTVTGATSCGSQSQCLDLKVDTDITSDDWKHYRYKVLDLVIPLRNVVWRS